MCDNPPKWSLRERRKVSYENWHDDGLTPLERAAGLWGIIHGRNRGECSCGKCEECEWRNDVERDERRKALETSARFKEATKLVAGIRGNREIKLALIQKVQQDNLESAIIRYMAKEALPEYYAVILKSRECIDRLVQGILYKVCHVPADQALDNQISDLSTTLRSNPVRISAYDRVTQIQQFIHRIVDQHFGKDSARRIPVQPMKNALSAARLHLGILDARDHQAASTAYLDELSTAASKLEYDEPRPARLPPGKNYYPRWRVRHLHPLSYYHTKELRSLVQALMDLDESIAADKFSDAALAIYAAGG